VTARKKDKLAIPVASQTPMGLRGPRGAAGDIDLAVRVGGIRFKNPFYVSSGPTSKSVEQMVKAEALGWAGASIKLTFDPAPYINLPPRYGYFSGPRFLSFSAETRLKVEEGLHLVRDTRRQTRDFVVFANISYCGDKGIDGWVHMAKAFEDAGSHIIELNMCCPNMSFNVTLTGQSPETGLRTGASLGEDAEATAYITEKVKKAVGIPVCVKITPEGGRIAQVAKAAFDAGADIVSSVGNRLGVPPIDPDHPTKSVYHLQEEPSMSCMSGPWLKPLALRDVYEIRKLVGPAPVIIGNGGMLTMQDAVEMFMCGADLVGFCTGILLEGFELLPPLLGNLKDYMKRHGYRSPADMRDIVVNAVTPATQLTIQEGVAQKIEPNLAAPCVVGCPAHVPAHAYVQFVARGNFREAYRQIVSKNPLQNVCGHVCSHPCENECIRGKLEEPIRIRDIKRFVLELAKEEGWKPELACAKPRGVKVAVVGSGPAGLSCAYDLARAGYQLTVFERDKEPGGMLRWAVPRFRLPKNILEDAINDVKTLGVTFKTGVHFGTDITLKSLRSDGYRAIFLGIGAQRGSKLGLDGEDVKGSMTALDFLRAVYGGKNPVKGKRVAVIGGGFTAVDSARTAVRLGASEVFILYRRTRGEMPAVSEEVDEAEEEGVQIMYLVSPKRLITEKGRLVALRMVNHVLGEKDASNRRRPVEVKETEFTLKADVVISALGQEVELDGNAAPVKLSRSHTIAADSCGATSVKGVFAGGDAATGASTLIAAIAAGKRAAVSIDKYLARKKATLEYDPDPAAVREDVVIQRSGNLPRQRRIPLAVASAAERRKNWSIYTSTQTREEAMAEAARCLNCGCGIACGVCYRVCMSMAISEQNGRYEIDREKCKACGMCFQRCPNLNIEMVRTAKPQSS